MSADAEPDHYADGRASRGLARAAIGLFVIGCAASVAGMIDLVVSFVAPEAPMDATAAAMAMPFVALFSLMMGIAAAIGLGSRALVGVPRWILAAAWTLSVLAMALPVASLFL